MIVITVSRKPVDGSVTRNALTHGTGSVNIDGSRIALGDGKIKQATARPSAFKWGIGTTDTYDKGIGREYSVEGRWPANLILEHRPECRYKGTQTVKGSRTDDEVRRDDGRKDRSQWRFRPGYTRRGYSDPDGTETVSSWDCVRGCPVADMDKQSGNTRVSWAKNDDTLRFKKTDGWGNLGAFGHGTLHEDVGGASCYFLQVGGQR